MKVNIGLLDQLLRVGISSLLIYVGFINEGLILDPFSTNIIGVFGVINMIIALIRFCPLYVVIGINTCGYKEEH